MNDTHPAIDAFIINKLRKMPALQKWQMVASLNASVREMAIGGLKSRYPNADEQEIQRRLADIMLGPELANKVYGAI